MSGELPSLSRRCLISIANQVAADCIAKPLRSQPVAMIATLPGAQIHPRRGANNNQAGHFLKGRSQLGFLWQEVVLLKSEKADK